MNELVSVIIPTYGLPDTLEDSVKSVLMQDYSQIEVFVVDDNDPNSEERNKTEILMDNLLKQDTRLQYLKHEKNKNGSAARNTGFRQSTGKFVCFLDNDDVFLQGKIKAQIQFLQENNEFDAVYCGYRVNGEDYHPKLEGSLKRELMLMYYEPVTSSLMFRREAIDRLNGFDEQFIRHQDYELMLRFFEDHSVSFVNEIYIDKGRVSDKNIVRGQKLLDLKSLYFNQFEYIIKDLEADEPKIRKKIYSRHYSKVFLTNMNHKYYKEGFKVLSKALTKYPIQFTSDVFRRVKQYVS